VYSYFIFWEETDLIHVQYCMAMVLKLFISKLHLFNDLVYDTFIDTINAKLGYILCVLD